MYSQQFLNSACCVLLLSAFGARTALGVLRFGPDPLRSRSGDFQQGHSLTFRLCCVFFPGLTGEQPLAVVDLLLELLLLLLFLSSQSLRYHFKVERETLQSGCFRELPEATP